MLSPLTDPVTALLNLSSGFHLRAGAEALPVGQAALHPLTSHSAGGNFLTYPSLSPNPSTLASWTLSEHTRHTSPLPLRLECCFPWHPPGWLPSGFCSSVTLLGSTVLGIELRVLHMLAACPTSELC